MLAAQPNPSLVLYRDRPRLPLNGVGRLPAALTINGITEYPVLRYTAGGGLVDAGATVWSPWGYGEDLAVVPVGVAPTPRNGSPGLGPLDDSVKFNASDYFQATNNAFADLTTEDVVIEFVLQYNLSPIGADDRILVKRGAAGNGYLIRLTHASKFLTLVLDSGVPVATLNSTALVDGCWYHILYVLDRSGSGRIYINGYSDATIAISTTFATLTNEDTLVIGARSNLGARATLPCSCNIAYLAMYKRDAWLDTHLQDTIAEQRASLFWGWRPQQARGTAVPTVRTRASDAYLDKCEGAIRKLYYVGNNVPRCVDRIDKNGARIRGYLPEVQITNKLLQGSDFNSWPTKSNCQIENNVAVAPDGTLTADRHYADAGVTQHYLRSAAITLASPVVYSVWVKKVPGTVSDWMALAWYTDAVTNFQYFDVVNHVTGNAVGAYSAIAAGVEDWGDGWSRCWALIPTNGVHLCYVYLASGNGGVTFDFAAVDTQMYLWGGQLENGVDYPTSYQPTAAAAVIREEDTLRYRGDDGNLGGVGSNRAGTVKCKILIEDYDSTLTPFVFDLNDGGSTANRIRVDIVGTAGDVPRCVSAATGESGGAVISAIDVHDGAIHPMELGYEKDSLTLTVDDTAAATDTDCGMPDEVDRIDIGVSLSNSGQLNAPLADIEFYERLVRTDVLPE